MITVAVLTTAAAAFIQSGTTIDDAGTMAQQLEPLLGPAARYFFALGLLAAGVSSAITAPLASSFAICGVMGWGRDLRSPPFRAIWVITLVMNRKDLLGQHANTFSANVLGGVVVLIATGLGVASLLDAIRTVTGG